mgnify:CR=1 FL=1
MFSLQTTVKQATLDSREVAEMVGKRHGDLMRDIRTYQDYLAESKIALSDFFIESSYTDSTGRVLPRYRITRKGCEFIAHKMTGQKGALFTAKYIERFHEMEQTLAGSGMSVAQMLNQQVAIVINEVDNLNGRVEYLEDNMTVDFGQQNRLQAKAKETAIKSLGGMDSPAYADKSLTRRVFSALWRDYKDYFAVASYRDTSRVDFDKALSYLANWRPQGALLREIEFANAEVRHCVG